LEIHHRQYWIATLLNRKSPPDIPTLLQLALHTYRTNPTITDLRQNPTIHFIPISPEVAHLHMLARIHVPPWEMVFLSTRGTFQPMAKEM